MCYSFKTERGSATASEMKMGFLTEEKRVSPRITLRAPLRYQIRGTSEFSDTVMDNISVGGMGFTNNKFIVPQTLVMLELNILSRMLRPIGKISWTSSVPHSERYRLGIEFLELDHTDKNYLSDFVDMQTGRL